MWQTEAIGGGSVEHGRGFNRSDHTGKSRSVGSVSTGPSRKGSLSGCTEGCVQLAEQQGTVLATRSLHWPFQGFWRGHLSSRAVWRLLESTPSVSMDTPVFIIA